MADSRAVGICSGPPQVVCNQVFRMLYSFARLTAGSNSQDHLTRLQLLPASVYDTLGSNVKFERNAGGSEYHSGTHLLVHASGKFISH